MVNLVEGNEIVEIILVSEIFVFLGYYNVIFWKMFKVIKSFV